MQRSNRSRNNKCLFPLGGTLCAFMLEVQQRNFIDYLKRQQTSFLLKLMKKMLIAQWNGYRIMTSSVFRLVSYKPRFHQAILSATEYDLPGKRRLDSQQGSAPSSLSYCCMINVEYCTGKSDDTLLISVYATFQLHLVYY